jgi:hypothetical protein
MKTEESSLFDEVPTASSMMEAGESLLFDDKASIASFV